MVLNFCDIFSNFSDPYYEFNSTIKTNNESDIFLEMDADKLAGQLLINQFLIILNDLEIEFQEDKITLIDNFHKIMYHLFDMFFRIHEKNIKSSHPSYYDRIHAISTIFGVELLEKKNILKISEENNTTKYNLISKNLVINTGNKSLNIELNTNSNINLEKIVGTQRI